MKKLIVVLLAVAMLLTPFSNVMTVQAATLPANYPIYGDVTGDKVIDTKDALEINKYRLGKVSFTENQKKLADVNNDKKIDIKDIERINQHRLKGASTPSAKIVSVFFDYGSSIGKSNALKGKPYNGNDKYGSIFTPSQSGYTFLGWYTEKSGGTKVTNNSSVGTKNHILYAHYKKKVPTGISVSPSSVKLTNKGATKQLTASVTPADAADKTVKWSSSNTKVATVNSSGKVTAVGNGKATITATAKGNTKVFNKITVTVSIQNKITVYKQTDSRWSNTQYGYKDTKKKVKATIGSSGCGLVSLTNAVYYLNGTFINPKVIASYSLKNGYRINGSGTAFGLYKSFANNKGSKYGIAWVHQTSSWDTLKKDLQKGYVAICSKPGHIMTVVDYNAKSQKYLLLDSYPSSNRGTKKTGYVWATKSYLQNTVGLRSTFYVLKSTKK